MEISRPITPDQVSALLGFVWVFAAWVYSEVLLHRKNAAVLKARHSDINLAVMDNSANRGEDQTLLLEEGSQAATAKPTHISVTSQIFRLFLMEETLLLENRLTLRAISELGGYLLYFYICDRTNLLGESAKNYSRDLFLFLYFLLIIVAAMTSFKVHQDKSAFTGKSILYLNRHQTEEWKGWMQWYSFVTGRSRVRNTETASLSKKTRERLRTIDPPPILAKRGALCTRVALLCSGTANLLLPFSSLMVPLWISLSVLLRIGCQE